MGHCCKPDSKAFFTSLGLQFRHLPSNLHRNEASQYHVPVFIQKEQRTSHLIVRSNRSPSSNERQLLRWDTEHARNPNTDYLRFRHNIILVNRSFPSINGADQVSGHMLRELVSTNRQTRKRGQDKRLFVPVSARA